MRKSKINKSQQGFTLVEVIVVAIIVAALAAVAIPLYNGYVTSSQNNAAANAAGSVASFMGACINQTGEVTGDPAITAATAFDGPNKLTCTITNGPTTSISVPKGVTMTLSVLDGSGQVTATPVGGGDDQIYSY